MRPACTIVTVCKNSADSLGECLRSVKSQSSKDYEHIIIDGASTDDSVSIFQANQHDRLSWISEPDGGIADAMNKGVKRARGEWLLFLHADDVLVGPTALQWFSAQNPDIADIISFDVEKILSPEVTETMRARPWGLRTAFKSTVPHQGAFIRRDLFQSLGGYRSDFEICMDYDWFLRAYWNGISLGVVNQTLAVMGGSGISSRRDTASLKRRFSEERRCHMRNAPNSAWRLFYRCYWNIYPVMGVWKHRK